MRGGGLSVGQEWLQRYCFHGLWPLLPFAAAGRGGAAGRHATFVKKGDDDGRVGEMTLRQRRPLIC